MVWSLGTAAGSYVRGWHSSRSIAARAARAAGPSEVVLKPQTRNLLATAKRPESEQLGQIRRQADIPQMIITTTRWPDRLSFLDTWEVGEQKKPKTRKRANMSCGEVWIQHRLFEAVEGLMQLLIRGSAACTAGS